MDTRLSSRVSTWSNSLPIHVGNVLYMAQIDEYCKSLAASESTILSEDTHGLLKWTQT